jgi:type IV secretion system protein VirB10
MAPSHNDSDEFDEFEERKPEIYRGLSAVASVPGRNVVIFILFIFLIIGITYYSFFSDSQQTVEQPKPEKTEISKKIETVKPITAEPEASASVSPTLPEPPPLVVPTPPPAPKVEAPPPPLIPVAAPTFPTAAPTSSDIPAVRTNNEAREALEARKKSGIMLGGGGASAVSALGKSGGAEDKKDDGSAAALGIINQNKGFNSSNPYFVPEPTRADQQRATRVGNLGSIIAQGKIIDAILETAINTDLPGQLRAFVSRDIYAEAGNSILIPKGSRLIGTYKNNIRRGQKRVEIIWSRLIRPDGLDIQIDSPGTDQLGRAGVTGEIDNKYLELFTSSALISIVSTAITIAADRASDAQSSSRTTSTDNNGNQVVTQTGSSSAVAINEAAQNMGSVARGLIQESLQLQPTITVDQGTRIKVFVNRDLIFPASFSSQAGFIQ